MVRLQSSGKFDQMYRKLVSEQTELKLITVEKIKCKAGYKINMPLA